MRHATDGSRQKNEEMAVWVFAFLLLPDPLGFRLLETSLLFSVLVQAGLCGEGGSALPWHLPILQALPQAQRSRSVHRSASCKSLF